MQNLNHLFNIIQPTLGIEMEVVDSSVSKIYSFVAGLDYYSSLDKYCLLNFKDNYITHREQLREVYFNGLDNVLRALKPNEYLDAVNAVPYTKEIVITCLDLMLKYFITREEYLKCILYRDLIEVVEKSDLKER